ncbi:hypothetical protein [Polaromonas sp. SM01]|uniref:hypothetical protein n=1 Tax=Polaromonas sp. SM01 TaxID=3085630 RepID=UPI002980B861|nr:hypothetical protein [Polaromonas sp. SM01]MDW5444676.1 hypothetical protein [Polaromonas sp. SM01]
MKQILSFCIFAVGLIFGHAAQAQTTPTMTSQMVAQRVDMVDGKPVFKPASEGKSGDVLQYSTTYRNTGSAAASKLLATVPVPVGTTLIAGSADPAAAQASTDGNNFAPMPLTRTVKQANGSERREPVPLSDYRALRWEIGSLPAGGTTVVSLRVRIDSPPASAAAAKP